MWKGVNKASALTPAIFSSFSIGVRTWMEVNPASDSSSRGGGRPVVLWLLILLQGSEAPVHCLHLHTRAGRPQQADTGPPTYVKIGLPWKVG